MLIRPASADADLPAIIALHKAAFASADFGYQGEGELVAAIYDDGDAIVSLVAEAEGSIIGHVLFSRMDVVADGIAIPAAGLAPVGVLPDWQGKGVGDALIRAGIDALHEQGVAISFVLGHPSYYPRFGYSVEAARTFCSPYAGPHFMALWLDKPATLPESGRASYAPAFSRES